MTQVLFKKAEYDYHTLKPNIFELLDALGGHRIQKNARVLIKPNLLGPAKPEKGIVTHPLIVRAVAEYVLNQGGKPRISDSPALGTFERVVKECGYRKALDELPVKLSPLKESIRTDIGKPFGKIDLAKAPAEADIVINLAKLKTHSQMLLTLGVKNLFGCVVGPKKPEWHMRCGVSRETFAKLLVQIYHSVSPAITLIDGIVALEGQGPGKSGTPRHLDILVGGQNAFDIDQAICTMFSLNPDTLPTHRAADKMGLVSGLINIQGDFFRVSDFKFPVLGPLTFGPKLFQGMMRKHMVQRPVVEAEKCRLCGECESICPAKVIRLNEKAVDFGYDKCIRCYCCVEICPHGALRTEETLPGKLLRYAMDRWAKLR